MRCHAEEVGGGLKRSEGLKSSFRRRRVELTGEVPTRFPGSNGEHAHGIFRVRNMRLASREMELVSRAMISFSFWRKELTGELVATS